MNQSPFAPRLPFGQRASRTLRRRSRDRQPRRAFQRGQTLVIFALSITVLLGLAGLAVDVMRVYDLYARELRAAEAGALAADLYMPTFYSTANPNNNTTAIQRALYEVQRNGFGAGATPPSSCTGYNTASEVTVCQIAGDLTGLQVTVTEPTTVVLLSTIGVQSFSVSATAGADYFDPYVLGANPNSGNSNVWGDGGSSNPKNYMASINGPAEFKEMGDPFVYCAGGPSLGPPADVNMLNATRDLSNIALNSDAGFLTNHPAFSGGPECGAAQPDQQPTGFTGTATAGTTHPGAYNFAINVNGANSTVWIYNPPFSPNDAANSCNGAQQLDTYFQDDSCSTYYKQYGLNGSYGPMTFDGSHFDDPRFAFDMTYSLYAVPSIYSRTTDSLVNGTSGKAPTYHPMDQISADMSAHNCSGGAYNLTERSTYTAAASGQPVQLGGCVSNPTSYTWQQIGTASGGSSCATGTPPSGGTCLYRLAVEATTFTPSGDPNPACTAFQCGWGRHTYAVAVCAAGSTPSGGTCTSGGAISAWNNMDLYLNFPSSAKNVYVPIAYIPSTYAGRSVTISIFNPGDSHGHGDNAYFLLVPPDPCITVTYPTPISGNNWVRTAAYGGTIYPTVTGNCAQNTTAVFATERNGGNNTSDDIYNGLWVPMTFTLPTSFTGGQFWLDEYSDQGKNFEEMAIESAINGGSPLHLIF